MGKQHRLVLHELKVAQPQLTLDEGRRARHALVFVHAGHEGA